MDAAAHFSASYREARQQFLAAADAAALDVESHAHPLLGRDGETLAMDVVRDGPRDARAVLLVSSACHGVEGFCGSGVQVALLRDAGWRDAVHASGVALLYVHALNPWGFSWLRRVTHENVDLNRNFHDFSAPLPPNPGYDEIAAWLVPPAWPPGPQAQAAFAAYVAERGERAFQTALTSGQHEHPEGLFYGGRNPTWSQVTLRRVLREHAGRCARLGWIDVHTGLGPSGHGELIFAGHNDDRAGLARARAWWGERVTSIADGSSSSAPLTGLIALCAYVDCPQAQYTGIALEYGTVPLMQVLDALRADQWLENHPETDDQRRAAIKQQVLEAFYTDTDAWKQQVLAQALGAAQQALRGLATD